MKRKPAIIVAGLYWFSVVATYIGALVLHDEFGFAFIPFMLLSLPWSLLIYGLPEQLSVHWMDAAVYAVLCIVASGVNAVMLYFLTAGASAVLGRIVLRLRTRKGREGQPHWHG